jgi:hypothetical protein
MALNLTNINQNEFLTRKRNGKPPIKKAKLTARYPVGRQPRLGMVWYCECDCGGYRDVPAMYFTSARIKQCERCVDPALAAVIPMLIQRREEIKEAEDVGWYPEPFRSTWRDELAAFDVERRLLFEVVMGGRPRRSAFMMQATDIVMRVPDSELDIEFGQYDRKRIALARARLARQLESSRS